MTFGNTISSVGISSKKTKWSDFLSNLKVPKPPKQIRPFIAFFQYFRSSIQKLSEKLLPFYRLLRCENELKPTDEHLKCIENLRKDLEQTCHLPPRRLKADAQYVIMIDASFNAACYVLMIEDYLIDQSGKTI